MLNIHNLSVSFGGSLFEEVTFRLGSGDRVGLVGKTVQEIYNAKNFS
jgi:ATP-binding cassette subfamily F protein 3